MSRAELRSVIGALLICASSTLAFAAGLTGRAGIIDGDTLEIQGTRIRLWGIDAPESTQLCRGEDSLQHRCGAKAANDLDAFIAARPVIACRLAEDAKPRSNACAARAPSSAVLIAASPLDT
jgi:endonuclease YncB( thermonuclease family)